VLPALSPYSCVADLNSCSMIVWMHSVKVKDRVPSKELRERLGIDDIILIL